MRELLRRLLFLGKPLQNRNQRREFDRLTKKKKGATIVWRR